MSAPVLSTTVMSSGIVAVAYIVAALLFVLSLAGLSKHETAKTGNTYGIVGMAVALVATIWVVFENRGYAVGVQIALVFLPSRGPEDRVPLEITEEPATAGDLVPVGVRAEV